jgi:CHAT domain-containing protein
MKQFGVLLLKIAGSIFLLFGLACLGIVVYRAATKPRAGSAESLLEEADQKAWSNDWEGAAPLYRRAELLFTAQHNASKALYARVSQMPVLMQVSSLPDQIWRLTQDLTLPEAQDEETRLRILTVRGMFEVNYDAATARSTWQMVEALARKRHHYLLASRAIGEQGIAAALLGDVATAKKQVLRAWVLAKAFRDKAAIVRYASVYGEGLVEIVHKYDEALGPLNAAIRLAERTPGITYPSIAVTSKVEALAGLGEYPAALALANEAVRHAEQHHSKGGLYQVLQTRAGVYTNLGRWKEAIADDVRAAQYARDLTYWRGLSEVDGPLARAYEREGDLRKALATVNEALSANSRIPDELFFAPRNLAIKAEIEAKLGQTKLSNGFYQKSADLIDSLLATAPTPRVEQLLIGEVSDVYSDFFSSLCSQGDYAAAFRILEKARGRIEAQALEHHKVVPPHKPTAADERLVRLNLQLIDTDDPTRRTQITRSIYETEQQLSTSSLAGLTALAPVPLAQLQSDLDPSEVIVEYVLDTPESFALAITHNSVHRYVLAARNSIEKQANQYRSVIQKRQSDTGLAQALFNEVLGRIPEYTQKERLIVIPDGDLCLLPFSALVDNGQYVLASHTVSTVPSGTVLDILRSRSRTRLTASVLPYVGVAAWTKAPDPNIFVRALIGFRRFGPVRSIEGLERSQLIALPASKKEVETIAADLPKPSTILEGQNATETKFKSLPLDRYNVLHLALHGYADLDYPDRSALVFAPQQIPNPPDDGLLQVREIRSLHLNASLVTLSACNTGVGPVGEAGVADIGEAFIEAGAESVVSTLWEVADIPSKRLMTDFYARLSHNEEKGDALRHARLILEQSGMAPYYWAGFELVGDATGTLSSPVLSTTFSRSIR